MSRIYEIQGHTTHFHLPIWLWENLKSSHGNFFSTFWNVKAGYCEAQNIFSKGFLYVRSVVGKKNIPAEIMR